MTYKFSCCQVVSSYITVLSTHQENSHQGHCSALGDFVFRLTSRMKRSAILIEDYHEGMQFVKLIVTILENNSPYFEYIAVLPKQAGCKKHRLRVLDMPNLKTNPQKLFGIPIFATVRIRPDFLKRTFFFRNQGGCCQIFLVKLKFVAFKKSAPFDSQNASIVRH